MKRNERLFIRVTPEEKESIKAQAKKEYRTFSQYMLNLHREHVKIKEKEAAK